MFLDFLINFYSSLQGWIISALILGLSWFLKKSFNGLLEKHREEKENGRKEFKKELMNSLNGTVIELKNDFDSQIQEIREENKNQNETLKKINNGLLSVQGKTFREECTKLLSQDHGVITVEEMTQCTEDHLSYNAMGGNDTGDELYRLVTTKFNNQNTK